ncbi:MAG: hypothetical protein P1P76_05310 [Anaerolineales bacterium]|nr:hypothetical protein [Anaerolineales bacterium]
MDTFEPHSFNCKGCVRIKKLISTAVVLTAITLLFAACRPRTSKLGFLEGQVTIGLLVPALREGEIEPSPSPEMFAARQVIIYDARGAREIKRAQLGAGGFYRVELPPGVYTVDINRTGIDTASGLPARVVIKPGKTLLLNFDIDTGIR